MELLYKLLNLFEILLFVRIALSWVNPDPNHPVIKWIYRLTEPVLSPIRSLLPPNSMGMDFSPIVVFLLISLLKRVILSLL